MTEQHADRPTRSSKLIKASPEQVYDVFMDPTILLRWLPPGDMTGQLHGFDPSVGGGYQMSLFYPADEREFRGKTTEREDRVNVRFVDLQPARRILEAVTFDSPDPAFHGEMTLDITLAPAPGGTEVVFTAANLPPGLRPQDHEEGARLSLEQLARLFE
ncbi:SRPBCC domain-containing protein [Phenylobacterium sp.]|uniref:SRPBCC domain-containing protein n=1 Tax=Phenylobacterium sp. TaxID=1871053 RepID=UPI003564B50D